MIIDDNESHTIYEFECLANALVSKYETDDDDDELKMI